MKNLRSMTARHLGCRLVLAALGGVMALSAVEHWIGSSTLREHYARSVLGANGVVAVAAAQLVAALGLLWPPTQRTAAVILAAVMAFAALTHVLPGGDGATPWLPLVAGITATIAALGLSSR
jgi:hypothetical protein